jgi:hypothetical protein
VSPARLAPDPWIADEGRLVRVAMRAFGRARRRPWLVLGIAVAAAAAATAFRATRPERHRGTLLFRLDEGELVGPEVAPQPPRDVQRHLEGVALSRSRLELLLARHPVVSPPVSVDPATAVEELRKRIELEVTRNYFIEPRHRRDEPRSASVTLSFLGDDEASTRAVMEDLAAAVLRHEGERRSEELARTRALLRHRLDEARDGVADLRRELLGLAGEAARAPSSLAAARSAVLELELRRALEQVAALERRLGQTEFADAAEGEQLGLAFRLVDEAVVIVAPRLGPAALAARAAAAIAAAALLAAAVVGAFDDRIRGAEDLALAGVPVIGVLPGLPAEDAPPAREEDVA